MVHVINTAIVEDETACSEQLKNYLQRYAKENNLEITTEVYPDGDRFLSDSRSFDVIFMDIKMPGSDGLSVVKRLRETDGDVTVFFVTGLAQYAVNGYEVRAFDFMVKPVGYYDFAIKFSRAVESLSAKRKCEIWVKSRQGKKLVTADKLMYVEVMRHNLVFHTTEGDVGGTGTLKSVTEVFEGLPFALCNQCYYVNLGFVTEVRGPYVYVGGDKIQISLPKKKEFMRALNDYLATGVRR